MLDAIRKRGNVRRLTALLVLCLLLLPPAAAAQGEEAGLVEEAERLTYELVELKARRKTAQAERDTILAELARLDEQVSAAEGETASLEEELQECQKAYNQALRSRYMRGEVTELEVILETRELEELWEGNALYDRFLESEVETLDRLKTKLSEVGLKKRDLREAQARRERLAEALDDAALDKRIGELEARLSEIGARLRALRSSGGGGQTVSPDPPSWTVPAPGELLDRVPVTPPLADFEPTGTVFSGYTTCYGEEFHGTPTASGVIFNMYDYTCAHRTLPFGTWLLVTFQGRRVIVQVNDRGPFVPGRVLDLSFGAAQAIGLDGVRWTEFEVLIPRGR